MRGEAGALTIVTLVLLDDLLIVVRVLPVLLDITLKPLVELPDILLEGTQSFRVDLVQFGSRFLVLPYSQDKRLKISNTPDKIRKLVMNYDCD